MDEVQLALSGIIGFLVNNATLLVLGTVAAIIILWVLRNPKGIRELSVPLIDELRAAILKSLNGYIKRKRKDDPISREDAMIVSAAIIGGCFLTAITLYAMIVLISNLATPVG